MVQIAKEKTKLKYQQQRPPKRNGVKKKQEHE